jgi:hypothetical protein
MTRSTTLLFSVFVGCCFAQTAALKELRSHEYPAAAPLIADHPVYVAGVVNSGTQAAPVCYSSFFENASVLPDKKLVHYFQLVSTSKDPLISGDARFIICRATRKTDCGALDAYRTVGGTADRHLTANANVGFSAWECNQGGLDALKQAYEIAASLGRKSEAKALNEISVGTFHPKVADTTIETSLVVPTNAHTMVLGESTIVLTSGMRVGTQVERVYRDWLGEEFGGEALFTWDVTRSPAVVPFVRDPSNRAYHEGHSSKRFRGWRTST